MKNMDTVNKDTAEKLLSVAESRRQHLSNMIVALNGLAITLILGVAGYFVKGFIDHSITLYSITNSQPNTDVSIQPYAFSYVVLAVGFIALILGLWRWYGRYLYNQICELYR